jgi:DNA-binding transcriptional ArsR family regulator
MNEPDDSEYAPLARLLAAVASPVRLEILRQLRSPQKLTDIRVGAGRSREGERPERALSRQTVAQHVEQLAELGLVERVEPSSGAEYVLSHPRLFALTDELRELSKLRALIEATSGATIETPQRAHNVIRMPEPPRLVVAYGRDDGAAFALHGPVGTHWRVGRAQPCEIRLDYDPFASSESTVIERTGTGFVVVDAGSRNGTWIDWRRLGANERVTLRDGAILRVGRSLLVFQGSSTSSMP